MTSHYLYQSWPSSLWHQALRFNLYIVLQMFTFALVSQSSNPKNRNVSIQNVYKIVVGMHLHMDTYTDTYTDIPSFKWPFLHTLQKNEFWPFSMGYGHFGSSLLEQNLALVISLLYVIIYVLQQLFEIFVECQIEIFFTPLKLILVMYIMG